MVGLKALLIVALVAFAKAEYELSPAGKQCVQDSGISVDSVKTYILGADPIPEDNKIANDFFGCAFAKFINDSNDFIVDDSLKALIKRIYKARLGDVDGLDAAVSEDLSKCKNQKGDNKGLTAIRATNCLKPELAKRV